jgi:hypothetical protein
VGRTSYTYLVVLVVILWIVFVDYGGFWEVEVPAQNDEQGKSKGLEATCLTISSTPKSFRHFSLAMNISLALGTSNLRARKNLAWLSISCAVARDHSPQHRRIAHPWVVCHVVPLLPQLLFELLQRMLLNHRQISQPSRERLVIRISDSLRERTCACCEGCVQHDTVCKMSR